MKYTTFSAILLLLLSFFFSCNSLNDSDGVSPIAMIITPKNDTVAPTLYTGEKIMYEIKFFNSKSTTKKLCIKSYDQKQGVICLLDSNFAEQPVEHNYIYTAPYLNSDSVNVKLTFTSTDNNNNQCIIDRNVIVKSSKIMLPERNGIVLYAGNEGKHDALCFANPTQTFCASISPDSTKADCIIENLLDRISMRSNTKAKFVRNNSFNYSEATSFSIQSVYENSIFEDNIDDIRINDIILFGHNSMAEGVMVVTNMTTVGNSKCIRLSFKSIK